MPVRSWAYKGDLKFCERSHSYTLVNFRRMEREKFIAETYWQSVLDDENQKRT